MIKDVDKLQFIPVVTLMMSCLLNTTDQNSPHDANGQRFDGVN